MNDELRELLSGVDPMPPDVPVESVTAPAVRERLERIMNTPLTHDGDHTENETGPAVRTMRWRRSAVVTGLVAATALVAIGAGLIVSRDGGDGTTVETEPLELSLGDSGVMASCLAFDVDVLADMSPAFAATAVGLDGSTVTLDVDKWYAGGDAEQVVLHATPGMQALIDGFDFEVGETYLITAADGTVNFCGYSGPATEELTVAFEQAFGA